MCPVPPPGNLKCSAQINECNSFVGVFHVYSFFQSFCTFHVYLLFSISVHGTINENICKERKIVLWCVAFFCCLKSALYLILAATSVMISQAGTVIIDFNFRLIVPWHLGANQLSFETESRDFLIVIFE